LAVVPGFQHDLFISYAHLDDTPWNEGGDGWVTEFVRTLRDFLRREERSYQEWFDPKLRTGNDFNLAIQEAISHSAILLCVLSPAYHASSYCRKEIVQFRACPPPSFSLKVGTYSRVQAILLQELARSNWPPELRSTSPHTFFDSEGRRISKPQREDETHPYLKGLWRTRDSILETLREMQRQKQRGTTTDTSYRSEAFQGVEPTVYLADVSDELFQKRENLRRVLGEMRGFGVKGWADRLGALSGWDVSIHMFGRYAGAPAAGRDVHISRVQLEEALEANPSRRPVVWLARELEPGDGDSPAHQEFLGSLLKRPGIELVRMSFEDLKDEIQRRVMVNRRARRPAGDPIIHIWHQANDTVPIAPLRQHLKENNCGISTYEYSRERLQELQSKLAFCDGLVVPYRVDTKSWAEDAMSEAFQLRRSEERPLAFAAVDLAPAQDTEFNFEHPRVVPVRSTGPGIFEGMPQFLEKLQEEYA
jgi:hypothetical protein